LFALNMSFTKVLKNSTLAFEDVFLFTLLNFLFHSSDKEENNVKYKKKCHHAGQLTNAGHYSLRS